MPVGEFHPYQRPCSFETLSPRDLTVSHPASARKTTSAISLSHAMIPGSIMNPSETFASTARVLGCDSYVSAMIESDHAAGPIP